MSIQEKVIEIVTDELGVTKDEAVLEAKFIEDLGADSLDLVELIMRLEEEFDCEIEDEEGEAIKTVQDAISFIENKTS